MKAAAQADVDNHSSKAFKRTPEAFAMDIVEQEERAQKECLGDEAAKAWQMPNWADSHVTVDRKEALGAFCEGPGAALTGLPSISSSSSTTTLAVSSFPVFVPVSPLPARSFARSAPHLPQYVVLPSAEHRHANIVGHY